MAARRYGRVEGARPEERAPRWRRRLAPALVVPAVLAGATSAVVVHATQLPGAHGVQERSGPPQDLGATGRLPQQQRPGPQLLEHAGDPQALATGGPPVPAPVGPQGIPQPALDAYLAAADRLAASQPGCGLDWSVLAAVGQIESQHAKSAGLDSSGTTTRSILGPRLDGQGVAAIPDTDGGALDGDPVWDRAVGPMQLLPSTWERYGSSVSGLGPGNPNNLADAALATGKVLCSSGGNLRDPQGLASAVFSYNHSDQYVRTVLVWAAAYARGVTPTPAEQQPSGRDPLAGQRVPAPPLQLEPSPAELGWPTPVQPGPGVPPVGPGTPAPPVQLEPAEPVEPSRPPEPAPSPEAPQPPTPQPPTTQSPTTQPPATTQPPETTGPSEPGDPGESSKPGAGLPSDPEEPGPPPAPASPPATPGGSARPAQPAETAQPAEPAQPTDDLGLAPCDPAALAAGAFRAQDDLSEIGEPIHPGTSDPSDAVPGERAYEPGPGAPELCTVPSTPLPPR